MKQLPVSDPDPPQTHSDTTPTGQMPQRSGVLKFLAIFCLVIVVALALGFIPRWLARSATEQQTAALAVPTVSVLKPQSSTAVSELILPADLQPFMEAPIYARISGYLKTWKVDIGAQVQAGEVLAEIEAPEVDQQLESARGKLAQAQANLALAQVTAKRYTTLLKSQAVSQQDADEKNADRDADDAAAKAAQADVRQLEQTQGFEKVIAPFAGTVSQRNVDIGALIQAGGQTPLFRIVQADQLRVYVQVPQDAARAVKIGATGDVMLPEIPGQTFPAKVMRTAASIDQTSRTLLVELQLDNSKGELFAGSHAQVKMKLASTEPRVILPANVLLFRAEGPQVGIVDQNGKVQLRSVQIGRDLGKTLEIIRGIEPNDRVIAAPPDSLADGETVRVAAAAPATAAEKK
jgi:RND family efflux transporter MFP subunit